MDIVLTMVPPGLSLSLSIGIEYAQSRLKAKSIVALKGRLINAAGRMKAVFFDKTGTLTINEMKLDSVYFCAEEAGAKALVELGEWQAGLGAQPQTAEPQELLLQHFATNHSLAPVQGELLGDPMERELFRFSHSSLPAQHEESAQPDADAPAHLRKVLFPGASLAKKSRICESGQPIELKPLDASLSRPLFVLSVWDFKPSLQRMSVVVRDSRDAATYVFTKGAPERVLQLCRADSLPANVQNAVRRFAKHGFRVLAFASKRVAGADLDVAAADPAAAQRPLRERPHVPGHRALQKQPQRTDQTHDPQPQASRLQGRHDHRRQHQHRHQHRQKLQNRGGQQRRGFFIRHKLRWRSRNEPARGKPRR